MRKFRVSVAATAIFLLTLVVVYAAHVRYLTVDVVFYAALADVGVAIVVAGAVLFLFGSFSALGGFEKLQLVVIWLLVGYGLAISLPTVLDRSLSFYILEKLQQRGGGIAQAAFDRVFTEEYMKEHRLVDVRLTEQLASGTILIQDGCVLLTPKGESLARFGRYFRQHWLPKERLLMGEYRDDLTDPFRQSKPSMGYECGPGGQRD